MKKYRVKINCPGFKKDDIIDQFSITNKSVRAEFGLLVDPSEYPEIFEEIKEPLFVTDDGVEIHENAEYYPVALFTQLGGNDSFEAFTISAHDCKAVPDSEFKFLNFEKFKFFSTKQAAKKWIEENKPVFSRKQIMDAFDNSYDISADQIKQKAFNIFEETFKNELGL